MTKALYNVYTCIYIEREREGWTPLYKRKGKKRESNAVLSVQSLSKQKSFLITQLRYIINFGTLKVLGYHIFRFFS